MKYLPFILCAMTLAACATAGRADDAPDALQTLLTKQAGSVVTVKVIIKTQFKISGQSQDSESRSELQGEIVSSDGLIMLPNAPFDTKGLIDMMGMPDNAGFDIKMTPTDFKVVIGNEEKQYSAFLAGADSTLGLAFIKIEDLGDRTLPFIDFASTEQPTIGEKVYSVSRLNKGYDYAPYVEEGQVVGQISKPKAAWVVDGGGDVALPVFTSAGNLLGVTANVPSGVKPTPGSNDAMGMGMMMRLFSGGSGLHTSMFLVPSSVLPNVIALAKQQAISVGAKRAIDKAATPAKAAAPAPKATPVK